jgi:cytochrome c oxidase subunit II
VRRIRGTLGRREGEMAHPARRRWGRLITGVIAVSALVAACGPENEQNALRPAGPSARDIDNLFIPVVVVAFVIGILVVGGTIYVALRYRRRSEDESPKQVHGNTPLEIGWTIVPALILAIIAVPTVATIFRLAEVPSGDDVLELRVVAKQWWWEFEYRDDGIVTANELYIPANTKVRLELTACDESLGAEGTPEFCNVIHSFWVPELAGKQDVVPGRTQGLTIEADEPGTYLGQCAEYCGLGHADMRFRVIALERPGYDEWVREQQRGPAVPFQEEGPDDAMIPAGEAQELVSTTFGCTQCHTFEDPSASTYGPNLTHLGSRGVFAGGTFALDRENLIDWVLDAPGMKPMESKDCRLPPPATCVGMPSFTRDTPPGDYPVMTRAQAETIVDYLLSLT